MLLLLGFALATSKHMSSVVMFPQIVAFEVQMSMQTPVFALIGSYVFWTETSSLTTCAHDASAAVLRILEKLLVKRAIGLGGTTRVTHVICL